MRRYSLNRKTKETDINVEVNIDGNWEEGRKFLIKNDNWIVDQFLHYNENVVDMRDIFHCNVWMSG